MPTLNKQPIFTITPVLYNQTGNPDIWDFLNPTQNNLLYTTTETTLIDRITVQIPVNNANPDWSSKTIYIIIYDSNTGNYSEYQREDIVGGSYTPGSNIPSIIWNFEGGLIVPSGYTISIQSSVDYNTNGSYGDYLSVTIEGGTYIIN